MALGFNAKRNTEDCCKQLSPVSEVQYVYDELNKLKEKYFALLQYLEVEWYEVQSNEGWVRERGYRKQSKQRFTSKGVASVLTGKKK